MTLCLRTLTWAWLPSPCSVHWVLPFKSSLFCILHQSAHFFMVSTISACILKDISDVLLKLNLSYLMVSSVVGFYSSPVFTGILPRAKDTNLTQVPDVHPSPAACATQTISADVILCFISDHCKQCVSAHPQLSTASLFTHHW